MNPRPRRAWQEDGDSENDLPMKTVTIKDADDELQLTDVWLCGMWLEEMPPPHHCLGMLERAFLSHGEHSLRPRISALLPTSA